MTFMIRPGWPDATSTLLAEDLTITFGEKQKVVRDFGFGREVAFDGWNRRELLVSPVNPTRATGQRAGGAGGHYRVRIPGLVGNAVRPCLRVLDDDDRQAVTDLDERIMEKLAEVEALRQERKQVVSKAWRRGETPNIGDLIQQAKEAAEARTRASEDVRHDR